MEIKTNIKAEIGRIIAKGYYNFQAVRIVNMNQIRDIIRKTLEDLGFNTVEEKKEKKNYVKNYTDKQLIDKLNQALNEKKISQEQSDFLMDCWYLVKGNNVDKTIRCKHCKKDFKIKDRLEGISYVENQYKKMMEEYIVSEPIYNEFLSKIRGIGIVLSAFAIKSFGNCEVQIYERDVANCVYGVKVNPKLIATERDFNFKEAFELYKSDPKRYFKKGYNTVSSLWKHTGNHVEDGVASKRRQGIPVNYNPKLKTFTWLIADCLMKQNKGYYRKIYDTEKEKQLNKKYPVGYLAERYNGYDETDVNLLLGHAHNRAKRKVGKHFLAHYWEASRELAGLSTVKTYVEGVLEHEHIVHWKDAVNSENTLKTEVEISEIDS